MKKLTVTLILGLTIFLFNHLQAQPFFTSGLEIWSGAHHPAGWVGSKTNIDTTTGINQYTVSTHFGMYACQLTNTSTSTHKRFTTQAQSITDGEFYEISYWVRGHGKIRCGCTDGGSLYSTYVPQLYHAINSTSWAQYKDTVVAPGTSANGEFIISVLETVADLDHLQIDSVEITHVTVTIPSKTIYEIQYTTDTSGNSPLMGDLVETGGIVTAAGSAGYYLQSGFGPWNGVYVYHTANTATVGDSVIIKGTVTEYFKLTEVGSISNTNLVSGGNPLPAPDTIPPILVKNESYEGVFIHLRNVECTDTTVGNGMFKVSDGNDTCLVDDVFYHYTAIPGQHYNITGVITFSYGEYKVLPRSISDVSIYSSVEENETAAFSMYPNPVNGNLFIELNGDCQFIRIQDISGRIIREVPAGNSNRYSLGLSDLSRGSYVVSVISKGEVTGRQAFIKE